MIMASKGIKTQIYAGMKTLNTDFSTEIPADHFSDTLNMVRNDGGLWEKRKGIKQFGGDVGSGAPVHSIHFWKDKSGNRYLTVGSDDDVYSYAEGAAYNDGAFTVRQAIGSANPWDAISYRDTLVLGNGVDNLFSSTDNTTFTSRAPAANVVKAAFLEVGNDFVVFAGDQTSSTSKDSVRLSSGAPANPWEYNSANDVNVDIGNADTITGIKSLGQNIIVCKERQTYTIALADLSRTTLDFGGGCQSNRAILRTQTNSVFIAGRQGVYDISKTQIGDNQLFGNPESQPIKELYDSVTDYTDINGIYTFDDNWALWNAGTTLGRLTFLRDLDYGDTVWTYLNGINAKDWTIYEDSDGNYHYLFADAATEKVWELFTGRNDNDAPIFSRLTSKRDDMGAPGTRKYVDHIDFYGYISKNATWNVELYANDNLDTPMPTGTITSDHIRKNIDFAGLGTASLGEVPLGGKLEAASGDLEVFPFYYRLPVGQSFEKLQWSLWNNQADVRTVFRAAVVYYQEQGKDFYDNQFIA